MEVKITPSLNQHPPDRARSLGQVYALLASLGHRARQEQVSESADTVTPEEATSD